MPFINTEIYLGEKELKILEEEFKEIASDPDSVYDENEFLDWLGDKLSDQFIRKPRLFIKVISRDWKTGYDILDVKRVSGMILHSTEEIDDGNAFYLLFVSTKTDIPAEELFKIWKDIIDNEKDVEGYKEIDDYTIERI